MCNLCTHDPEEQKAAAYYHTVVADKLRTLARDYDDLSRGVIKPHTKEAETVAARARGAIRELVEWI